MFIERNDRPISATADFGLSPGEELFCSKGFSFSDRMKKDQSDVQVNVTVIKEYPRFILVKVIFDEDEERSYKECINKADYIGRDVDFERVGKKHIYSQFAKQLYLRVCDWSSDPSLFYKIR